MSCKELELKSMTTAPVAESKMAPRPPECTTTGYLRCFNIWEDLFRRGLFGPDKMISIFGLGLMQIDGIDHCPQLPEAIHFFQHCSIACIDSNLDVLMALKSMKHEQATVLIQKTFAINPKPPQAAEQMEKVLKYLVREGKRSNKVQYRHFRMGEDDPNTLPDSDVMIATFSLMYPLKELWENKPETRLDFFIQYISRLKKGGILYVDTECVEYLLLKPAEALSESARLAAFSKENIQLCINEIFTRSKIRLEMSFLSQNLCYDSQTRLGVIQPVPCNSGEMPRDVQTKGVFTFERLS